MRELARDEHERKKEERQLQRELDAAAGTCGWCFTPHLQLRGASTPGCRCHARKNLREVFAGL